MYENCVSKGAAYNEALYCTAGDRVVEVFAANHDQPRDAVIQLMTDKILEIGPEKISMHMSDTHYTFDVAPSSIPVGEARGIRRGGGGEQGGVEVDPAAEGPGVSHRDPEGRRAGLTPFVDPSYFPIRDTIRT